MILGNGVVMGEGLGYGVIMREGLGHGHFWVCYVIVFCVNNYMVVWQSNG